MHERDEIVYEYPKRSVLVSVKYVLQPRHLRKLMFKAPFARNVHKTSMAKLCLRLLTSITSYVEDCLRFSNRSDCVHTETPCLLNKEYELYSHHSMEFRISFLSYY